jgi:hypothetical protein
MYNSHEQHLRSLTITSITPTCGKADSEVEKTGIPDDRGSDYVQKKVISVRG